MLAQLKDRVHDGACWNDLEVEKRRARWEQVKREVASAEIDWYDCAIVQTIGFTAADATSEPPPPMSVEEVQNMTLAQERMTAMIMETMAEDVEVHRARQAAAEAEAPAAAAAATDQEDTVVEERDEDDDETKQRKRKEEEMMKREIERAKAIQASSLDVGGTMKIRTDYVPKLQNKGIEKLTTCTVCGQQIPVDELQERMRIGLLDTKWKSQRDALEARKAQVSELQRGANVVSSLKNLARTRRSARRKRRKEREKVVWDGHTAFKANTLRKFLMNSKLNVDEQNAARKGLGP
ncbi:Pre-mRNA splicing factor PRP21 like protein-domain-containing protein [Earliella scabrosa]|nr:Pre-mRNA splicing factor PRP21 like protein-domain-containing protein [Earliella scabrosa]